MEEASRNVAYDSPEQRITDIVLQDVRSAPGAFSRVVMTGNGNISLEQINWILHTLDSVKLVLNGQFSVDELDLGGPPTAEGDARGENARAVLRLQRQNEERTLRAQLK